MNQVKRTRDTRFEEEEEGVRRRRRQMAHRCYKKGITVYVMEMWMGGTV